MTYKLGKQTRHVMSRSVRVILDVALVGEEKIMWKTCPINRLWCRLLGRLGSLTCVEVNFSRFVSFHHSKSSTKNSLGIQNNNKNAENNFHAQAIYTMVDLKCDEIIEDSRLVNDVRDWGIHKELQWFDYFFNEEYLFIDRSRSKNWTSNRSNFKVSISRV